MKNLTATTPTGWTPRSWQQRLTYLADVCIDPSRAAQLRAEAEAIGQEIGEPRVCFECGLELGGPAVARPYDPGAIVETNDVDRLLCRVCAWRREREHAPGRKRYFLRLMRAAT